MEGIGLEGQILLWLQVAGERGRINGAAPGGYIGFQL